MSVTTNMIIVEDRLAEMFAYLPTMSNEDGVEFGVTFKYGDQKELLAFIKSKKNKIRPYPLIWLVYPYTEFHKRNRVVIDSISLVLAVETNSSMLNEQRMRETYDKVLIPLYNNLKKMFLQANIAYVSDEYSVTKFPNYSDEQSTGEENQAVDIWDALKVTFPLEITGNCLQPIRFD